MEAGRYNGTLHEIKRIPREVHLLFFRFVVSTLWHLAMAKWYVQLSALSRRKHAFIKMYVYDLLASSYIGWFCISVHSLDLLRWGQGEKFWCVCSVAILGCIHIHSSLCKSNRKLFYSPALAFCKKQINFSHNRVVVHMTCVVSSLFITECGGGRAGPHSVYVTWRVGGGKRRKQSHEVM